MVYESDFYTTRRPYRPSTTYSSLTAELIYRPTSRSVTRLVTYPEPPHHVVRVRVRPSVVLRELDRINHRVRPQLAVTALDNYYNAESTKTAKYKWAKPSTYVPNLNRVQFDQGKPKMFEEEKRRIRAETEYLLSRARSVVPRAKTLAPSDTIYTYSYGEPIPYRFSDAYVAQLPRSLRSVVDHINHVSFYKYHETPKKFTGRGNLACVHFSGNKAFSNRRPLYKELSIRDDVNLLSFYAKNRLAAAGLAGEVTAGAQEQPTAALSA